MDDANNKYILAFKKLGIPIKPLPANYTPEEYARKLISASNNYCGIAYSDSTDIEPHPIESNKSQVDE